MKIAPVEWMTVAEAAKHARRHDKTLLAALRRGELRGYQRDARCAWRIDPKDVDRWIRGE